MIVMAGNIKHLAFGVCATLVLLSAFVVMASATTEYAEEGESIQAVVGVAMSFHNDVISPHHTLFDRQITEDELPYEKHILSHEHQISKHRLDKQNIRATETQKSNYTFSLHGDMWLLWSYVNDERNAYVASTILDDVNEDGVVDFLAYGWNLESKLFAISGRDGSTIWSKNYPLAEPWITGDGIGDVNGDGIGEAVVCWDRYNWNSNQTNITIELLSGSDGDKIWSKKISYEGDYHGRVCGTRGDLTGDGVEDVLIEVDSCGIGGGVLQVLDGKDGLKLWERTFGGHVDRCCCACSDLTGDGINDLVVWNHNHEELFVIRGSDGSTVWHTSFVIDYQGGIFWNDFDEDGLNDIGRWGCNANNKTSEIIISRGTDGSVIWNWSDDDMLLWIINYCSDINADGVEDLYLGLTNFTRYHRTEVRALSGRDGSLIWKKEINVSDIRECDDLDGDDMKDILLINSIKITNNRYLCEVTAISGVNMGEIWKNSFVHDIKIEVPENACWDDWPYPFGGGWCDLNGDGIVDPLLEINRYCDYWGENVSTHPVLPNGCSSE